MSVSIIQAVSYLAFLGCLAYWLLDLNFYRKNGWDFSQDHPGFQMYNGDVPEGNEWRLSNRNRVQTGGPFMIFVTGIIALALTLF
jgi:hypothetical protein